MVKNNKHLITYYVLIIVSIIFTILDIIASNCRLLVTTLILSSITMIISFIGKNKMAALQIENNVDKSIEFIKKNFSLSNVVLSIIDVICCIIALITGLFVIAIISRSATAIRYIVLINKYRTVVFGILTFVFIYLFKRRSCKLNEEVNVETVEKVEIAKKKNIFAIIWNKLKVAFKWIYANKKSICGTLFATISGIASAIVMNYDLIVTLPEINVFGFNLIAIIVGILIFAGVEVGVIGKGFENIKTFYDRISIKKEKKDADKKARIDNKNKKKAEKQLAKDKAEAIALSDKKKKEEEREKYLLELAKEIKEKEENKDK